MSAQLFSRSRPVNVPLVLALIALAACGGSTSDFRSAWSDTPDRVWPGPEYWSNPLQDWRVVSGRLENAVSGGDRNVFLLTREVSADPGTLEMAVTLGQIDDATTLDEGFVGFRVGIKGRFHDYRDSALRGIGLDAGMATDGRLFVGRLDDAAPLGGDLPHRVRLELSARPAGPAYRVELRARDERGTILAETARDDVPPEWLTGGVALVSSAGPVGETPPDDFPMLGDKPGTRRGGNVRFWFDDWRVSGTKVTAHEDRTYGPILFAMHTLSRQVLKLTAQMAPVGAAAGHVHLEIRDAGEATWREVAAAPIDPLARTATFRVAGWDASRDVAYRVRYALAGRPGGAPRDYFFEGTIRHDPVEKPALVVAAFTGNNDVGFPHADVVRHVSHFRPDLLAYTGDQIYERVGEYGIQRAPLEAAMLDYLRKWYIFGWEYRDLLRDIPSVELPDDHDVYQGNIWGAGGPHAEGFGAAGQDQGGYTMPAEWVNATQRTQASHLPDPDDPTPIEQGINVYYTSLRYGGLDLAVIEDRTWKSAPKVALPDAEIVNGWSRNPGYDARRDGDVAGAELLGPRQEAFLERWAADWSGGVWMKVVVSQSPFADVMTLPVGTRADEIIPKLPILAPGEYPDDEGPVQDHDSNAWPQSARNRALRAMRKGLAVHIAGDQHLGSTVQYGIDTFGDAGWVISVPSVANYWPRRWFPPEPGGNHQEGSPRYTGDYFDGFGNRVTVHAVSNPVQTTIEPHEINERAPGYGIVTFDRAARTIAFANWPRWVDPAEPGAAPYPGWPITVAQTDNGLPPPTWVLDPIDAHGLVNPVVQVVDQASGEIVYTLRIEGAAFTPTVYGHGVYTVKVGEPDSGVEFVHADQRARRQ